MQDRRLLPLAYLAIAEYLPLRERPYRYLAVIDSTIEQIEKPRPFVLFYAV